MENEVYLGEDGVLHIVWVGDQNEASTMQMAEDIMRTVGAATGPVEILFDTTRAGKFSIGARQVAAAALGLASHGKAAVVASSMPTRALGLFILSGAKAGEVKVFDTRGEGLSWLREPPEPRPGKRRRTGFRGLLRAVSGVRWLRIKEPWLKQVFEVLGTVAMGDFSRRIGVSSHEDELTLIEAGINLMADDLQDRQREAKEYERRLWEYSQGLERMVAERTEELRESEARYRGLFENANDIIVSAALDSKILDVNQKGVELLGYSREEWLRMNMLRDLVAPQSVEAVTESMRKVVEEGSVSGAEAVFITKTGASIDLEINSNAHYDSNGAFSHATCILRDITERKRAAQEILRRNRELAFMEERNRLARELHDSVSQLLFSVVLNSESATTLAQSDPEVARARMESVRIIANEAQQQMRGLLTELRLSPVEDGLVAALKTHVDALSKREGIEIAVSVEGERPLTAAVERELFRIAQEALNNIAKHSKAASARLELGLKPGLVCLSVEDDGVGFDPSSPESSGSGMGLTSMRERAEGIGGRLEIESALGKGTKITVEVPLEEHHG